MRKNWNNTMLIMQPGRTIRKLQKACNGIKEIKVASSIWMKESDHFPNFKGWQEGYGTFTYSVREKDEIINYIKNQKEHHQKESFHDELRRLLIENGVAFDEKYLL